MRLFLVVLLALAIVPGVNAFWEVDNTINASLPDVGSVSDPCILKKDGTWFLISGSFGGTLNGFNWTDGVGPWQADSGINASLPSLSHSSPACFYKENTLFLLVGNSQGTFKGFNWTDGVGPWQADSGINASIGDIGSDTVGTVFVKDGTHFLISNTGLDGVSKGFNWTDGVGPWQEDNNTISGLSNIATPHVFFKDGTHYLINKDFDTGIFNGFNWTDGVGPWQADNGIIYGLPTGEDTAGTPVIFQRDTELFLISGEGIGTFNGFKWNENTTVTTPTITSPSGVTTNTTITLNATIDDNTCAYWFNSSELITACDTPINSVGLIGAWHLGEGDGNSWISNQNISDYSGNGNDGEIFGAEYVRGRFEKGLMFNGVDAYVNGSSMANVSNSDFSVSAWLNFNDLSVIQRPVVLGGINGGAFFINFDGSTDKLSVVVLERNGSSHGTAIGGTPTISKDQWYNVVATVDVLAVGDYTNLSIYIDGTYYGSVTTATTPLRPINGYELGHYWQGAQWFSGSMDEVRIYNRSLSADEILEEYSLSQGFYNWAHSDTETTYTIAVQSSDSYINSSQTNSALTVNYCSVSLFDETTGTFIPFATVNGSMPIIFQNGTSFNIEQTTNTGNNVTFKNIDAFVGQRVRVEAKNTSHGTFDSPRSVVSGTYAAGDDFIIFMPPNTKTILAPSFILTDVTGDFEPQSTTLRIKKYINSVLVTIFEDFFDLERDASAFLISDEHYLVELESIAGEVRDLGRFVPETSADVPIFTGPVKYAPGNNINDLILWNVTKGSVDVNYLDVTGNTTVLSIIMYNASNRSQILQNCTNTGISARTCVLAGVTNVTVFVEINATTGFGLLNLKKFFNLFDSQYKIDLGLLEPWHYTLLSLLIVIVVFMIFNDFNAGVGAIVSIGTVGLVRFFGWIDISNAVMAVLVLFAFFAFVVSERRSR